MVLKGGRGGGIVCIPCGRVYHPKRAWLQSPGGRVEVLGLGVAGEGFRVEDAVFWSGALACVLHPRANSLTMNTHTKTRGRVLRTH